MSRVFPEMSDEVMKFLWLIKGNMEKDPEYLSSSSYPSWIKEMLTKPAPMGGKLRKSEDGNELEEEIIQLYNDMNLFGGKLDIEDAAQKMAYYRTRASLLERLLSMRQEAFTLKKMQEFRSKVMRSMEELLDEDQRIRFIDILGNKS